jgi:glycine/D-amino acid oxidase-like deaminating enzyme
MWPFRKNTADSVRTRGPYWLVRDGIGDASASLTGSIDCDVAIIGAGITGALVADALVATGRRIVVLDTLEPAQGSTAASTALLQYEVDTHLVELTRRIGAEPAMRAYHACAASFGILERRMPELLSPSDYQRRPSLYLAADEQSVPVLRAELAARHSIGIECEWLDAHAVRERFGCLRPGAILSPLGAQVDPCRLTRGLMAANQRHGVRLYTRTRVTQISEEPQALRLHTASGHEVVAAHVVVCAGYESLDFLPRVVAQVNNTFALVTEPIEGPDRPARLPLIWESSRPYLYLRGTPDGRLLVGGADLPFKNAVARDALLPRQVRRLADSYRDLFGKELPAVAFAWAGSFAETEDGLPYIGHVPGMSRRLQFALCFGGNGITYSAHAGDIVRAGIEGRSHPLGDVFGFARLGQDFTHPGLEQRSRVRAES